jgi:hypothetical protein
MLIRAEDGVSHDCAALCLWRIMPAASPLRGRSRPLRASQPSGWLVVANRVGTSGASLVCLASCEHRGDALQLLAALRLALPRDAASFNLQALRR